MGRVARRRVDELEIFLSDKKPQRAILLVDHGSRRADAQDHLIELAAHVARRLPDDEIAVAHMEFGTPDIPSAIAQCVAAGAGEIIVHPFFLNTGLHVQETIPGIIEEARAAHPRIEIRVSEFLGLHDGLVAAVVDRIADLDRPKD
jgi:sirohydrochlorin ferrochelatase